MYGVCCSDLAPWRAHGCMSPCRGAEAADGSARLAGVRVPAVGGLSSEAGPPVSVGVLPSGRTWILWQLSLPRAARHQPSSKDALRRLSPRHFAPVHKAKVHHTILDVGAAVGGTCQFRTRRSGD